MAKFLVSNGDRFLSSHKFQYFPLTTFVLYGENEKMKLTTERNGKFAWLHDAYADYIHRPKELEELSSYEFTQQYEVWNTKYPINSDNDCYEFLPSHPIKNSKHVRPRNHSAYYRDAIDKSNSLARKQLLRTLLPPNAGVSSSRKRTRWLRFSSCAVCQTRKTAKPW